jgi:hypothetical protein
MRSSRRIWPLCVLLAEVLAFFRHILFYGHYAIPWDFRYYHFSQASFVARSLARGELPLWDPYTYCGMPFYANLTAQVFYPPTLAAILLSNWTGGRHLLYFLELQLVAHVFLGGALAYWLLRRLRVGRAAALAGATVYQLGAYTASQTQHLGAVDVAAWMPLAWLAVVELRAGFRRRWAAGLAFAFAMAILAGFPAATAVVFVTCFLLGAILSWRSAAFVAVSAVWAVLLAAIQVFPTLQLSRLSVAQYRGDFLGTGGGMPLESLVSLVRPNYYGIFQFDGGTWKLPWDPTFLYTYCGIPALLFVALALASRRSRYAVPFALVTLCAGLWMLGDSTAIGRTVFVLLPDAVKGPLYAQFALCGFSLGMAVLAGLGADRFLRGRARWMQAGVVAVVAADLIVVSSGRPFNTVDERVDPGIAYDHYDRYPEIPAEIRRLVNQSTPPWRIDLMGGPHDMASAAPLFEYPAANGDDPFALVRLMQVRLSFCRGERWGRFYEVADPDSPVLKLMNVRYLISSKAIGGRRKIGELPGTVVYENPGALPRFFLVHRVRRADGMQAAVAALRARDFDPRTEAVVEGAAPLETGGTGTVRVLEYGARQLALRVETAAPAFLVTSEAAFPGWRAWIDGRAARLVLTNVAFRGLAVPAGNHVVTMRFDPGVLWGSAWVTIAAGLVLAIMFAARAGPWTSRSS